MSALMTLLTTMGHEGVDAAADEVRAMPVAALRGQAPNILKKARSLRELGMPLLRALLDVNGLPSNVYETAMKMIAEQDPALAVETAFATEPTIPWHVFVKTVAAHVKSKEELFDIFGGRWLSAGGIERGWIQQKHIVADERFVDVALKGMQYSPEDACLVLALNGSRRAAEELCQIIDNASDPADRTCLAAIEALSRVDDVRPYVASVARYLSSLPSRKHSDPWGGAVDTLLQFQGRELAQHSPVISLFMTGFMFRPVVVG